MFAPALLLSLASASAEGSPEALRHLLETEVPTPFVVGACTPVGAALSGVAGLVGAVGKLGPLVLPEPLSDLLSLADPELARTAGIDPAGVLALGTGPDRSGAWVSLPFDGSPAQAEALLTTLRQAPEPTEKGWMLGAGMDVATLASGTLRLQRGVAQAGGGAPDLSLLQDLPVGPSCTFWAGFPEDDLPKALARGGPRQGVVSIPLSKGGELLLRTRLDDPAPELLARPTGAPAGGTTTEAPTLVLAVGVSPFELLTDPTIAPKAKLDPSQIKRAKRKFNLAPGATMAVFGDPNPKRLDFVLVLPVRSPPRAMNRARALDRRAVKILQRLGREAERTSATTFTVVDGDQMYFGATAPGRVILGTRVNRVAEVAAGRGTSWLDGADLDRLHHWPVALWTGAGLATSARTGDLSVDMGLRSVGGAWELGLRIHGEPPGGWALLLAAGLNRTFGGKPALQED